jgi:fatty-acyl-CoA synthase
MTTPAGMRSNALPDSRAAANASPTGKPQASAVAVVAKPDVKWGETPCAIIEFKAGASATPEELNQFCRSTLAGFKIPKTWLFEDLPKTATGKIEKYKLRERVRALFGDKA